MTEHADVVRVVVDGTSFGDGSAVRGIGSTLRPLLAGLAATDDIELVLLTPPGVVVPPGLAVRTLTPRGPGRFRPWEHLLTSGLAARHVSGRTSRGSPPTSRRCWLPIHRS